MNTGQSKRDAGIQIVTVKQFWFRSIGCVLRVESILTLQNPFSSNQMFSHFGARTQTPNPTFGKSNIKLFQVLENNIQAISINDEDLNSTSYLEDPNEFEKVKQYKHILVNAQAILYNDFKSLLGSGSQSLEVLEPLLKILFWS